MSDVGSYLSDYIYDYVSKVAKANADKSYDVTGTVTRVEDGVAFIQFENSSIETPVEQTISVKPGDNVKVRVSGRKAWVVGNSTVPPTGDAKAIEAATEAGLAKIEAATAQKVAGVAEEKATTAIEAATTGVDNKISAYDSAVQEFTNLMANAYGMYRSEISDPINPGANVYALHNNSTYDGSTFAMLLNSNGLYVLNRDTTSDPWTVVSASASDGAALVESITANSAIIDKLLSKDVTVTGALHSDDYIAAATGASPPYAQQGMGLDFGEKEFEAEHFAVDADGKMWASEGKIGPFYIGEMFDSGIARPALYSDWYVYKQPNGTYERSRVCIAAPRINYVSGGNDDRPVFWAEVETSFDYDPNNPEAATWTQPVTYADIKGWGAGNFRTIDVPNGGRIGVNTTWGLDVLLSIGNSFVDKIGSIVSDPYNGAYGLGIEGEHWLTLIAPSIEIRGPINTEQDGGITIDGYGNFTHKRSNAADYWNIQDANKKVRFAVYFDTAHLVTYPYAGGEAYYVNYVPGDTVSVSSTLCSGCVTSGGKDIYFNIPFSNLHFQTPTIKNLSIIVRHVSGGYVYTRSGTDGATYTALSSGSVSVVTNGSSTRSGELTAISCRRVTTGLHIRLTFAYVICRNTSGTAVTNNTPLSVWVSSATITSA